MYKNYKSKANTLILYNYVLLFNAETNMHFQNNPTHELQINVTTQGFAEFREPRA